MLINRTSPAGIDWYIQNLQTLLHSRLKTEWNMGDTAYKAYGRCYRNKTDDGYTAENYEGSGEYREVYWDDSLTALSFFGISGQMRREVNTEADIHLVFFVDLAKAKPLISHRADEEVRSDVLAVLGKSAHGFTITGTELWLENVLREYPGSRRDNRLKAVDMHPIHCFRINMTLIYNPNKTC